MHDSVLYNSIAQRWSDGWVSKIQVMVTDYEYLPNTLYILPGIIVWGQSYLGDRVGLEGRFTGRGPIPGQGCLSTLQLSHAL